MKLSHSSYDDQNRLHHSQEILSLYSQEMAVPFKTTEYLPPAEKLFPAPFGEVRVRHVISPDSPSFMPQQIINFTPPPMHFWENAKDALIHDNIPAHYAHGAWRTVLSYDWHDPNFKFKEGELEELKSRYPEEYHSLIASSTSQKWLDYALDYIDADLYRKRRYEASGWDATAGHLFGRTLADGLPLLIIIFIIQRKYRFFCLKQNPGSTSLPTHNAL
ncbi:hypothetical protein [Bartonella sp. DGB2]|uniref:hypothetical protein n=1 Tax=Bartonella sp. DGB2 TaxID=3388426 RepID=UPI00398FD685